MSSLFLQRINGIYTLLHLLYKNEVQYTDNLFIINEKFQLLITELSSLYSIHQQELSFSSLQSLFQFFQNKYIYQSSKLVQFEKEVLSPISKMVNDKSNEETINQMKTIEKELSLMKIKIEKTKKKYNESLRKVEDAIFDFEMSLRTKSSIISFQNKKNQRIEEGKEIEKEYQNEVNLYNTKVNQLKTQEKLFNEIDKRNYEIENEKLSQVITIFETSSKNEKDNYRIDTLPLSSSIICCESDLKNNVIKEILFEPYIPSLFTEKMMVSDEVAYNILFTLKEKFNLDYGNKYNLENAKKEIDFKSISSLLIEHSNTMTMTDLALIKSLISEKKYRTRLIMYLNTERTKGFLFNNVVSFNMISSIFNYIFDNFEIGNKEDYDDEKNALLLTQSFYKIENGTKIYIEEELKNNKMLTSKEFWKGFITVDIQNEFQNNKALNDKTKKQIPYIKIAVQLSNLVGFLPKVNFIYELIDEFDKEYGMNCEEVVSLKKEVDTMNRKNIDNKNRKNKTLLSKSYSSDEHFLVFKSDFLACSINSKLNINDSYLVNFQ